MTMRPSLHLHQRADQVWSWTYVEGGLSLAGARTYPRLEAAVNAGHTAYPQARIERIEHAPAPRRAAGRRDPTLLRVVSWVLLIVLISMRLRRPR